MLEHYMKDYKVVYPPTKQVKDEPKPHGKGLTGLTRRIGGYSITLGNSNVR